LLRDGTQQLGHQPEAFEGRTDDFSPERSAREGQAFETGSGRWNVAFLGIREPEWPARMGGSANRMMRPQLDNHYTEEKLRF
jgi:hypothetical protein